MAQERPESAIGVELAELLARSAEDEVGARVVVRLCQDGVHQAHRLEGHLLLGGAGRLLPLQRDQLAAAFRFVRDNVDDVLAATEALADVDLAVVLVAPALERRQLRGWARRHIPGVGVDRRVVVADEVLGRRFGRPGCG